MSRVQVLSLGHSFAGQANGSTILEAVEQTPWKQNAEFAGLRK
jgi:hypothetical protein